MRPTAALHHPSKPSPKSSTYIQWTSYAHTHPTDLALEAIGGEVVVGKSTSIDAPEDEGGEWRSRKVAYVMYNNGFGKCVKADVFDIRFPLVLQEKVPVAVATIVALCREALKGWGPYHFNDSLLEVITYVGFAEHIPQANDLRQLEPRCIVEPQHEFLWKTSFGPDNESEHLMAALHTKGKYWKPNDPVIFKEGKFSAELLLVYPVPILVPEAFKKFLQETLLSGKATVVESMVFESLVIGPAAGEDYTKRPLFKLTHKEGQEKSLFTYLMHADPFIVSTDHYKYSTPYTGGLIDVKAVGF